jgi:hypothetical protein
MCRKRNDVTLHMMHVELLVIEMSRQVGVPWMALVFKVDPGQIKFDILRYRFITSHKMYSHSQRRYLELLTIAGFKETTRLVRPVHPPSLIRY